MKLIIREYLSSLREREELDAILPDLLSELGFNVYSRPKRGTTQHGVDIAAISPSTAEQRIYLFSLKRGDLTRQDWDNDTPQALRASLNEIQDAYIPNLIPPEYSGLKITICLCFGGEMRENVRSSVMGYIKNHTTNLLNFEEWNGDKLAGMLLEGILREDLLPRTLRSNFQKSIALLDEPQSAYEYFARLAKDIQMTAANGDERIKVRAARQLYICLWIVFVWARDVDNIEAPYLISELALLTIWEIFKEVIPSDGQAREHIQSVYLECVSVHLAIADQFLGAKILPFAKTRDALAAAVRSQSPVDVNLKLFDLLGRVAMTGLWVYALLTRQPDEAIKAQSKEQLTKLCDMGMSIIENNQTLVLPVCDEQGTSVALFLMLCVRSEVDARRPVSWIEAMVERYYLAILSRQHYPVCFKDYRQIIDHTGQRARSNFEDATAASTLIPLLMAWAVGFRRTDIVTRLFEMTSQHLSHCTMQLWLPDSSSEEHIYLNSEIHGTAVADLPMSSDGKSLVQTLSDACDRQKSIEGLSAISLNMESLLLLACRHWRLPIPPWFWIKGISGATSADA